MIVGAQVEEKFAQTIRAKIKTLLASKTEWFSGAEPEHLCEGDLDILEEHDYFMSRKGNGLRSMLFIFTTSDGPAAFLWTCMNALWYNPMLFPLPNNPNFAHTDTLIDGELNFTQTSPDQPPYFTYTAFDLIAIGGVSVAQRSLSTRLGILQQDIIKPRNLAVALKSNLTQPFRIEMAHHERSYAVRTMAPQIMAQQGTGLIFTPVRSPYVPNRSFGITKLFQWTFPEFNCCSFKLHVVWDKERKARYQLHIADRQSHKYFDDFTPEPELLKEWKSSPPDGKIIDCRFDKEWDTIIFESGYAGTTRKGGWRFCRFRADKHFADEEKSMRARWNSLIDPVTLDMFIQRAESIRTSWKLRERKMSTPILASPSSLQSPTKVNTPFELKRRATQSILSVNNENSESKRLKIEISQSINNQSEPASSSEEEEEEIEEGFVAGISQLSSPKPLIYHSESFHDSIQTNSSNLTSPTKLSAVLDHTSHSASHAGTSKKPSNKGDLSVMLPSHTCKSVANLELVAQKVSQIKKVGPNYIPPPPIALKGAKIYREHDTIGNNLTGQDDDPESPIEDYALERYSYIQEKKLALIVQANQSKIPAAVQNTSQIPDISSAQEHSGEEDIANSAFAADTATGRDVVEQTSPRKRKAKNSLAFLLN